MVWVVYIKSPVGDGLFPPQERAELSELIHQAPINFGLNLSRWTLGAIAKVCCWLKSYTPSGIWRLLRAWRLHYKRGQQHIHSPDPDYEAKRDRIRACQQRAQAYPDQVVILYLDEFSFTRWPTVAPIYHEAGADQPEAGLTPGYNPQGRLVAAMDGVSGRVVYRQRAHIRVSTLVGFMGDIRQAYPDAREIYIVQDNWHNVHFHPDQKLKAQQLGITLVPLPVYAPWLNPIEKLGRKLKQQIVHMHRHSQHWPVLRQRVCQFMDQLSHGSDELLRYVGLLPN